MWVGVGVGEGEGEGESDGEVLLFTLTLTHPHPPTLTLNIDKIRSTYILSEFSTSCVTFIVHQFRLARIDIYW